MAERNVREMTNDDYDHLWRRPEELLLTGKGRIIAVIDQPLWQDHPAYCENINSFIGDPIKGLSQHGAAVMSIVVGDIGIATDAKVVYCAIETWNGRERLLKNHAKALQNLSAYVEAGNPIDVVTTSHGWMSNEQGASDNDAIISWFETNNIPVFSTNDRFIYPCGNQGAAHFLQECDFVSSHVDGQVSIPVDNRLLAHKSEEDIISNDGNLYYRMAIGGLSWAVPFVTGLFALAREANPSISRQDFLNILLKTARRVDFGGNHHLPVADMKNLCEELIFTAYCKVVDRPPINKSIDFIVNPM